MNGESESAQNSVSAYGGAPTPATECVPHGVRSTMRAAALRSPTVSVAVRICLSTSSGKRLDRGAKNRSLPVVLAVDRVEAAGEPHPHRMGRTGDRQRRQTVVGLIVAAGAGRQVERRCHREWLSGSEMGALVEYLLAAAQYLDAGAGVTVHQRKAFGDIASLRSGIGPGDQEVVGEPVYRDAQEGLHAVVPGLPMDTPPAPTSVSETRSRIANPVP